MSLSNYHTMSQIIFNAIGCMYHMKCQLMNYLLSTIWCVDKLEHNAPVKGVIGCVTAVVAEWFDILDEWFMTRFWCNAIRGGVS